MLGMLPNTRGSVSLSDLRSGKSLLSGHAPVWNSRSASHMTNFSIPGQAAAKELLLESFVPVALRQSVLNPRNVCVNQAEDYAAQVRVSSIRSPAELTSDCLEKLDQIITVGQEMVQALLSSASPGEQVSRTGFVKYINNMHKFTIDILSCYVHATEQQRQRFEELNRTTTYQTSHIALLTTARERLEKSVSSQLRQLRQVGVADDNEVCTSSEETPTYVGQARVENEGRVADHGDVKANTINRAMNVWIPRPAPGTRGDDQTSDHPTDSPRSHTSSAPSDTHSSPFISAAEETDVVSEEELRDIGSTEEETSADSALETDVSEEDVHPESPPPAASSYPDNPDCSNMPGRSGTLVGTINTTDILTDVSENLLITVVDCGGESALWRQEDDLVFADVSDGRSYHHEEVIPAPTERRDTIACSKTLDYPNQQGNVDRVRVREVTDDLTDNNGSNVTSHRKRKLEVCDSEEENQLSQKKSRRRDVVLATKSTREVTDDRADNNGSSVTPQPCRRKRKFSNSDAEDKVGRKRSK